VRRRGRSARWAAGLALAFVAASCLGAVASAGSSARSWPADPVTSATLRTGAGGHDWSGHVRISFRNSGASPLSQIWLRLWPNGILGCRGGLEPLRVSNVSGGTPGPPAVACSALPVALDAPVAPGARGQVAMDYRIVLPQLNDRFGWFNNVALLGTALPLLAVENAHGPHLNPYSDLGESYESLVGDWRITLDVPRKLVTPTTGVLHRVEHHAGRDVRTFRADDVREFAWAAGPFDSVTRRDAAGTRLRIFYLHDRKKEAEHVMPTAVRAMNLYSRSFGGYPYPEMDIVAVPLAYGGMEYPTIVFSQPARFTVAHELAHQWWYGLVGDDEYRWPFLDEAFATWSELLNDRPRYAKRCGPYGFPAPGAALSAGMDYWDAHQNQYGPVIYTHGACALAALANRFGLRRFVGILHRYARAHRLRRGFSTMPDFRRAIERAGSRRVPGWNVKAFLRRWRLD
jgi:hypothetical protein